MKEISTQNLAGRVLALQLMVAGLIKTTPNGPKLAEEMHRALQAELNGVLADEPEDFLAGYREVLANLQAGARPATPS